MTPAAGLARQPVRRLTPADLADCNAVTDDWGWPPEVQKWRLLFAVGEVYGVADPAGGLAGIVALTRYGSGLAAVGMLVVASRYARQGLGRRLMEHVITIADGAVLFLTATELGRPLYDQLGFRTVETATRHIGVFAPQPGDDLGAATRLVAQAGLDQIRAADRHVFGADRGALLAELATQADCFLACGDPVNGYAAAWRNGETLVVGPVVATDEQMAAGLIRCVAAASGPIRLDVCGRPAELSCWLARSGLPARHQAPVMVYGGSLPGARDRLYAQVNVAIG